MGKHCHVTQVSEIYSYLLITSSYTCLPGNIESKHKYLVLYVSYHLAIPQSLYLVEYSCNFVLIPNVIRTCMHSSGNLA